MPRKLATGRKNVIEKCGENALQWLKEGRSPLLPHSLVKPFGTRPVRAWAAEPPNRWAGAGDFDPDAVLGLQAHGLAMSVEEATEAFASAPAVDDERGGEWSLTVPS